MVQNERYSQQESQESLQGEAVNSRPLYRSIAVLHLRTP